MNYCEIIQNVYLTSNDLKYSLFLVRNELNVRGHE